MFDSGIKASELILQIKDEADISIPIENTSYIAWMNSLEQLLYTELIQEQGKIEINNFSGSVIDICTLNVPSGEAPLRFEDIHAVYADHIQLIKSTVASGSIFPNTFYKIGNNIGLNTDSNPEKITIVYYVKPKLKTADIFNNLNVMVPIEFIDLVKSKLRAEAYKMVNEGDIASMWINDYNVLLETFKEWLSWKQPRIGI